MSKRLSEKVYDYLKEQIIQGELLPGAALNLNEISAVLKISRSPLRDALIRLEAEGFLTIYPRSKVLMNKLDIEDIAYLFEIIGSLESTLIIRSLDAYTEDVLDRMYKLDEAMRKALELEQATLYDLEHRKFHDIFLEIAPNKFVERILTPIKCRLWDLPRKNFPLEWMKMACDEHLNIIKAIEKKDPEKVAFELKMRHWDFAYNSRFINLTFFSRN